MKISPQEVQRLFNEGIRKLAREGFYSKEISSVVDATDIETTEKYEGCGKVTRKKKGVDKRGREQAIEVTVYGWKMLVMWCIRTRMPIAVKVVKIHEQENDVHPLSIHMGINSGVALVGSTRFEGFRGTRWTFTASGPVTNLAARLAGAAESGRILVGPETARRLGDHYQLEMLGHKYLKNIGGYFYLPYFKTVVNNIGGI